MSAISVYAESVVRTETEVELIVAIGRDQVTAVVLSVLKTTDQLDVDIEEFSCDALEFFNGVDIPSEAGVYRFTGFVGNESTNDEWHYIGSFEAVYTKDSFNAQQ